MFKYPVYQPALAGKEKEYVMDCLDSSWISSKGKYIAQFEEKFSKYIGVNHSTAVSNGTVAIHLALEALGIGPGDEVIVPTFTYIASVNAIMYTGATPVFVDSLMDTWQMDPADVRRKITPNTRAVMAVHLYGYPCDMDALTAICKEHGVFLVEDCAEAFGTKYKGRHVGTFGDVSTFSFFGNKTITTGEGGMVVTNDLTLHERNIHLKGQGLAKHRQYWHDVIGYNYRMTNICAAIGLAQLERADEIIKKKRQVAAWYKANLEGLPLHVLWEGKDIVNSFWMITVGLESGHQRDALREHLAKAGVETRPTFYPVHTMPMYSQRYERHENAGRLAHAGMNLPSYPDLNEADVKEICGHVRKFAFGRAEANATL